jgi:hypothetical protein
MAGLDPAIHVFLLLHVWLTRNEGHEDVDARDKRGHDGGEPINTMCGHEFFDAGAR